MGVVACADNNHQAIIQALTDFGVTRAAAVSLASMRGVDLEAVQGWIAYASRPEVRLRNPAGFVVSRLGAGERLPMAGGGEGDRRRYVTGRFKDFIRH